MKIQQVLERYKQDDPLEQPKLAVLISVLKYIQLIANTEADKTVSDLLLIVFYYLLGVDEYTYHRTKDKWRTKQF